MTDFLFFRPDKLKQFRLKDKYLIPQDCVILGNFESDLPIEVQGYLKIYGNLKIQGYLTVSGYIFSELGISASGDISSGSFINGGDAITSFEGNITAVNDIRTTGHLQAFNGIIKSGEGFGIFAGGEIVAVEVDNGANVYAGVATWHADPDKTENIKAEKVRRPSKVKLGNFVKVTKKPK